MGLSQEQSELLLEKLGELPPERLVEVVDFIDFLLQRDQTSDLQRALTRLSEPVFAKIWDNPQDAAYDEL